MRVVVADDNLLVRQGLVALLAAQDGYEVVAECGDLAQLELAVARTAPDVVDTDIRMPPSRRDEGVRFAADPRRRDTAPASWCSASTSSRGTRSRCSNRARPAAPTC
jgi:DNA-binding NarL/FixJ family response regulator